ncbi:glycosyltransferase [Maribacter litopenaei]|uniref:Glycosyltransferase n=1 Tax=Maribacter litopenaei TaxID=2976127 RepID=A0ABY5YDB0_9FLAO|nr:glycosyltransferase [Maribacter litopenaei]UWX56105.1 glycosyltransferase [Maribacter litopenaei]
MKKSNIAFVIPSLQAGGAERVVSALCNELIEKHNLTIITYSKKRPFYVIDARVNLEFCCDSNLSSVNAWQAIRNNYFLYRKILKLIKKNKIDVIIGFMTNSNILTVLVGKRLGLPTIISERIDPSKAQTNKVWKILKRIIYPLSNYLIVQTEPIKKFFTKWMPNKKIIILPNPIFNTFSDEKNSSKKQKKENIILNVGRLTSQKGQEMLIRSFANINPKNWKLQLIGTDPMELFYKELIVDLKMSEKIELLGLQKNVIPFYKKAKIFAFPSLFEGFPNALIEAMYMGMACISTDCPTGPSEIIINGTNGFLTSVNNQSEFEEKLNKLITDDDLILQFSKNAPTAVMHLETKNVVVQWERLIENVLK